MCCCFFLIESYYLIGASVEDGRNKATEFSGNADKEEGSAVSEMIAPFLVVLFAIFPHFFKSRIGFLGVVKTSAHY